MAATQLTYVYGVRKPTGAAISSTGIAGASLHEVQAGGLSALVSDLPGDEELQLGREELTAHARVLEQALEAGTVLPMRFGVVMEDEQAVKTRVLEAHKQELEEQLQQFEGKVELRVRAIYNEAQLMREVLREDPEIAKLRERVRATPEDASYFDRIQLGEMVAAAIERKREIDTEAILKRLEKLAHAVELGSPTHERMVMSASFLVDREQMPRFDSAVDEIGRREAERMRLKYTGPLPPHSFAELATSSHATATEEA